MMDRSLGMGLVMVLFGPTTYLNEWENVIIFTAVFVVAAVVVVRLQAQLVQLIRQLFTETSVH